MNKTEFKTIIHRASVVRVVDGDTVEAYVDLPFEISVRKKFRLARIDAKEDDEKAAAFLESLVLKTTVKFMIPKKGKFNWLCEIFRDNENVNDSMVKAGHAHYWGDSKPFTVE